MGDDWSENEEDNKPWSRLTALRENVGVSSGTNWCIRSLRIYIDAASGSKAISNWSGNSREAIPA
jgi:hypothetical protein